jgi:hypothetical protein
MLSFGRSLFSRGAAVAPAPAPTAASPAAAANAAARAAANAAAASAAPAAAAPVAAVAAAPPRSWGNYLRQGTTFNTKRLNRATAARNAAKAAYNANKTKKNAYRNALKTYAAELRASKKIENENTKAANAAAAELIESKGASSKFFDNVINPNGSALNRYFKRDTDFQIFNLSTDMNPKYINNETKTGFREYTTGRNTNKKNNKQFYTDHKETIENYKLVGTKILPDVNIVFIRMFGVTEGNAVDNLQLYVTELRKSVDAEKKSAQVWAQRKEAAGTAGRAAYTAGLGLAAAPLAVAALPVGLAVGTGVAAKGVYNYGVKPAGQCVGAACKAVYNAATSDSQIAILTAEVRALSKKVDALAAGPPAAAAPSTVAAAAANAAANAAAPGAAAPGAAGTGAAAALASGATSATPTIDFTAVLNSVGKTDELTPKLRAALETVGVAEDKILKVLDAASTAWNAASGGAPGARVAAATAAQAAFDAPTAGGRRPSRRYHKKHTMMTRRKKSKNKKH